MKQFLIWRMREAIFPRNALSLRLCVVCIGFVAVVGKAGAWPDFVEEQIKLSPPPHPTAIFAEVNKAKFPVVKAVENFPIVDLGGTYKQVVPDLTSFFPERAKAYGKGYIELTDSAAVYDSSVWFPVGMETKVHEFGVDKRISSDYSQYAGTLKARQTLKDCHIVIMTIDKDFFEGKTEQLKVMLWFQKIPDLEKDVLTSVTVKMPYFDVGKNHQKVYCPLIFSEGREIRTSRSWIAGRFFRRLELSRHTKILEDYERKFGGTDQTAKVYLRISPVMPESLDPEAIPESVDVILSVTSEGLVSDVNYGGPLNTKLKTALDEALEGWLFVPRLVKGDARASTVKTALLLRDVRKKEAAPATK